MTDLQRKLLGTMLTAGTIGGSLTLLLKSLSDIKNYKQKYEMEAKINAAANQDEVTLEKTASKADYGNLGGSDVTLLNWLTALAAIPASVYATHKGYNWLKDISLKAEKKEAEKDTYKNLKILKDLHDYENKPKYAKTGTGAKAYAGLLTALVSAALASAYMSRSYLKDKFPLLDSEEMYDGVKKTLPIKRIKFDESNVFDKEAIDEEDIEKTASNITSLLEPEVNEALIKIAAFTEDLLVSEQEGVGINDAITSVAMGYIPVLKKASVEYSDDDIFFETANQSIIKHASEHKELPGDIKRQMAITYIANDKDLSNVVVKTACEYILDSFPTFADLAKNADTNDALTSDMIKAAYVKNHLDNSITLAMFNVNDRSHIYKQNNVENIKTASLEENNIDFLPFIYDYLTK